MKLLSKEHVGSLYAISSGLCYGFLGYSGVQLLNSNLSIANMLFWRFLVAAVFTFTILLFKSKNILQPLTENLKIIFYGIAFYGTSSITYFIGSNYIGSLTASAHSIYASTTGKGIWKLDLEALGAQENPGSSSTQDMQHINCYPNPATRLLTIDCSSLSFAPGLPVNYTFTTLTGAKVAEFERTEQHFSVSLSGMASGVYYLMAEQGAHTASVMVTIVE